MTDMKTIQGLLDQLRRQQRTAETVDGWLRPSTRGFDLPPRSTQEHRALADLSRTPWLRLVVDNVVQALYVDNIVGADGPDSRLQQMWYGNGLQSAQVSMHRAMIAYGHAYGVAQASEDGGVPRIRFVSPNRMAVTYANLGDVYPSAALEVLDGPGGRFRLHRPGAYTDLEVDRFVATAAPKVTAEVATGLSFVPVVRFANQVDLDGRVEGEVLPFIPAAARINKTAFDRLLSQHFNSWKVKTATGLELPSVLDEDGQPTDAVDAAAAERMKLKLAQDDVLVGETGTTFGTLDATALEPFVTSWRADIEALAAVSQTPTHALTGQMVNLGAEALASARAPLTQKVAERQMTASAAYSHLLRAAGAVAGWDDLADDAMVRVTWQDMEIRSLAQAADALGKMATSLRIPAEGLWPMIPGVEATELQEWRRLADEELARDPLQASFSRQAASTADGVA